MILNARENILFDNAKAYSTVVKNARGNGGDIRINTGNLSVTNDAFLNAATYGRGSSSNIIIDARENVLFDKANAFSTVEAGGVGNSGDIRINTGSLSVINGASLNAYTSGQGSAGNVIIDARENVLFDKANAFSTVVSGGVGNGGNIRINTGSLSVIDGAVLTTSTFGQGNAGNVIIDARENVLFDRSDAFSTVESRGVGNGGDIRINTGSLSVINGAMLTTGTRGQGNGGNVIINTIKNVLFDGTSQDRNSRASSRVHQGSVGKGGDIRITTGSLSVTNGAYLTTSIFGEGNAGNIQIQASENVNITGSSPVNGLISGLYSTTVETSTGQGGNISVDTNAFRLSEGAVLSTRTRSNNKGGNITVNASTIEALNGGQVLTTTSSSGSAGTITVNATEQVIINGSDVAFNDKIAKFPDILGDREATANSGFFVSSTGSGITGDISVTSPKITLDNGGRFIAESRSGNGGNINLNVSELLLLRRGAQISTNAGTAQKGGDGGNIDINSKFIVAVPQENSDISANAYTGTGGNVQITSQGIFGIESRSKPTDKSEITASSELGVAGVTNINSPETNLQNSLTPLPENLIDTSALIANSCIARRNNRQSGSTFYITGNGSLPERPGDAPLSSFPTGGIQNIPKDGESTTSRRPWKIGDPIVEPQGVYRLANGELVLSRECP